MKHKAIKIPLIITGGIIGLPVFIVICALLILSFPSVQQKAVSAAATIISDKTGIEASIGHFSIRPPFDILLKDVFAGDGQGDTLAFIGKLDARIRIDALPDSIAVRGLELKNVVAHTDTLIPAVRIDGTIGLLWANAKSFSLEEGCFRISEILLRDTDVSLGLNKEKSRQSSDSAASAPASISLDFEDVSLENIRFHMEPPELDVKLGKLETSALVDIGNSCYTVRRLDLSDTDFGIGALEIPIGGISGDAVVDIGNSHISSNSLAISVPAFEAEARLSNTEFDLKEMNVVSAAGGRFAGSPFNLDADYDIDDELFRADLVFGRTDLAKILKMSGQDLVVAGSISVSGAGINPKDRKMHANVAASLDSCRFNGIDVSGIKLAAALNSGVISGTISSPVSYSDKSIAAALLLDSRFSISDFPGKFPGIKLDANLSSVNARTESDTLDISGIDVDFKTEKGLCKASVNMPGLSARADVPAHVLEIPSLLPSFKDSIRTLGDLDALLAGIPKINADLSVEKDNPLRGLLRKRGFDLTGLTAGIHSPGNSKKLSVSLKTPDLDGKYRLPAMNADLSATLSEGIADARLNFDSDIRDGLMSITGIDTRLGLNTVLARRGDDLRIDGDLKLADLIYAGKNIGDKNVNFNLRPDPDDPAHFIARAGLDDIPLELAKQFADIPDDIGFDGIVQARTIVSGIPDKIDVFAGVKPVGVAMEYRPYDIKLALGEREITLEDNRIRLNGLPIIGADSTFLALDGGLDLNGMKLDVSVKSDGFEPVSLPKGGPLPVFGKFIAGLDGSITGPVDSLSADIGVAILPETDITYPINKKNLAQVSPAGTINVGFNSKSGLNLGGQLDVTKGKLFYSPKLYPMMPFTIDKGSCIRFNGALDETELSVSASQGAKAIYKPQGEVSRMVDFVTGVRVGGTLKKINIGFYLDAVQDKEIQQELSKMSEEDREGLAAVLLATGMYASESNEAAQMEGYALSSIVQSKLNAASSNTLGKVVDVDFGVSRAKHDKGVETTDYTISVSKSFFHDKLNIKVGGGVSDNAEVNKNSASFLNNVSAEVRLDSAGAFKARLFSVKDYNNIIEGELVKSGVGLLIDKTLARQRDSLDRSLDLEVEANVVHRSNNQLGPDAAVSLIKHNIFSKDDIFTAKIKGAYYWNLNRKQLKDPSRNDTYLFGADLSLNFPYLQLGKRAHTLNGQTLYRLGFLNENISGDYSVNKLYGGVDYSIRRSRYVTHGFSPFYLSVVLGSSTSESLPGSIGFVDLLKLFINNEFIPSTKYSFSYNNYRDRNRAVNTAFDLQLKESANLISGVMALCGRDFNERFKQILGIDYDQFVKCQLELRNRFRLGENLDLATRVFAGAAISFGNSVGAPLSEAFSIGGPNSIRAFSPNSLGPGDFHNNNYSSYLFHTGDLKLEMNAELRFPIVWKLNGAMFVDAGNVWNQRDPRSFLSEKDIETILKGFNLTHLYNSHLMAETFFQQLALGTGLGLRLDYESIVIRLDLGVALHAPYDTGKQQYFNISNYWKDGLRLNFGIGYPF